MTCKFKGEMRYCDILDVVRCPENCKFRKTQAEYNDGIRKAQSILDAKGLKPFQCYDDNGIKIMSTRSIR